MNNSAINGGLRRHNVFKRQLKPSAHGTIFRTGFLAKVNKDAEF